MTPNPRKPLTAQETRFSRIIGHNVRLRRKEIGMKGPELSKKCSEFNVPVSGNTLYRIESGEAVGVRADLLVAFAHVLGCTVVDLLVDRTPVWESE